MGQKVLEDRSVLTRELAQPDLLFQVPTGGAPPDLYDQCDRRLFRGKYLRHLLCERCISLCNGTARLILVDAYALGSSLCGFHGNGNGRSVYPDSTTGEIEKAR